MPQRAENRGCRILCSQTHRSGARARADFNTSEVGRGSDTVTRLYGEWRSLVARCVRDAEVVGSNPASPTNTSASHGRCVGVGLPLESAGTPQSDHIRLGHGALRRCANGWHSKIVSFLPRTPHSTRISSRSESRRGVARESSTRSSDATQQPQSPGRPTNQGRTPPSRHPHPYWRTSKLDGFGGFRSGRAGWRTPVSSAESSGSCWSQLPKS